MARASRARRPQLYSFPSRGSKSYPSVRSLPPHVMCSFPRFPHSTPPAANDAAAFPASSRRGRRSRADPARAPTAAPSGGNLSQGAPLPVVHSPRHAARAPVLTRRRTRLCCVPPALRRPGGVAPSGSPLPPRALGPVPGPRPPRRPPTPSERPRHGCFLALPPLPRPLASPPLGSALRRLSGLLPPRHRAAGARCRGVALRQVALRP
jgi:hypothetical protein